MSKGLETSSTQLGALYTHHFKLRTAHVSAAVLIVHKCI